MELHHLHQPIRAPNEVLGEFVRHKTLARARRAVKNELLFALKRGRPLPNLGRGMTRFGRELRQ